MKKSSIKRVIGFLFAFMIFVCSISLVGCYKHQSDENSITVFSWEDYIDDGEDGATGLLEEFEKEYGIKVNYRTFATCEEMYNELKKDENACDLLCPSEYMILKMKEEGLIKPFAVPENYKVYGSPYIKGVFDSLGLNTEDGKTYAVGYMWGTMGLIYNDDKYDASDFNRWSKLLDKKFSKKVTVKDSIRDTYILAVAIVYEDELIALKNANITEKEYEERLFEIFNRTDKETVDKVGKVLTELKKNLHSFEVDGGKIDLLTGKIDVNFAWSGDAVYAMYEADEAGEVSLGYAVPEEGSNVWFDGFVMTKNADEVKVNKFLDFICRPNNAIRNMDYVGYTSCIAGDEVFNDFVLENFDEEEGTEVVDLAYFFDPNGTSGKEYKVKVSNPNGYLYAQYADEETISRCAVMDNFSNDDLELVNEMWNKVKLITLPNYGLIIIVVGVVIAVVTAVVFIFREKLFKKAFSSEQNKPRKKGYKVVKIENVDYYKEK